MKLVPSRLVFAAGLLVLAACGESIGPAPSPVASVSLTPPAATAVVGGTVQLTAAVNDAAGSELTGRAVTWASSDTAVATVSGTGLVTGVALGSAMITATSEGQSGAAEITVGVIRFARLSAGSSYACGITMSGAAYCWGYNSVGVLGNGTTTNNSVPAAVMGGLSFADVSAAGSGLGPGGPGSHTCGIATSGDGYCWGYNVQGELGDGLTTGPEFCDHGFFSSCSSRPVAVEGGLSFVAVSAGESHTCAVAADGAAYCWGYNGRGELGTGLTSGPESCGQDFPIPCSTRPVAVEGGLRFATARAGGSHTCAVAASGAAYCWGANFDGQLGDGSNMGSATPVPVAGGLSFTVVTAGARYTCGLTSDGVAYCWGYAAYGQLGNGAKTSSSIPVTVMGGLTFVAVSAGMAHTCGVTTSGAAYCWGANYDGQLGNGSNTGSATPVAVAGGLSFTAVTAGDRYACGLTSDGVAYCWGFNGYGRLGNGTTTSSTVPVKVAGQP